MADNKNVKTKIWVYAVVLFTSAFIVLLFAAYSQIKMSKNLDDYKNEVSSQKSEKNKYQLSFANAKEVNNKLNEEIKKLQEENKSLSDTIDRLITELGDANDKTVKQISVFEEFSLIQKEYFNGNVVASAELLKKFDTSTLNYESKNLYITFSNKVFDEAGKLLFDEGYKLYKQGKYSEAIGKFSLSSNMWTKGSYSDECLFYLANATYKAGNKLMAVYYMNKLVKEYPESPYLRSAKRFIQKNG